MRFRARGSLQTDSVHRELTEPSTGAPGAARIDPIAPQRAQPGYAPGHACPGAPSDQAGRANDWTQSVRNPSGEGDANVVDRMSVVTTNQAIPALDT